jgi:hypothetical protein
MSKIQEIIVEPNKIVVGSTFKLKVRVIDSYLNKKKIVSENRKNYSYRRWKKYKNGMG